MLWSRMQVEVGKAMRFRGLGFSACVAVQALFAVSALAQQSLAQQALAKPNAVVELFTSQGCSSCPPADLLFTELARDPSLIVMTLPVDYWDYLGWKDTLALPAFAVRQRSYAQTRGDNTVYTPQAFVNGGMPVVGSDRAKIGMVTARSSLSVAVSIDEGAATARVRVGGMVQKEASSPNSARDIQKGGVFLVPVMRSVNVTIARGENRGRQITYANVARGMHRLGDWTGEAVSFDLSPEQRRLLVTEAKADGFVILLQSEGRKAGKILGGARSAALAPPST